MKDLTELVKDYLAENHSWCKKENEEYHFPIDVDYRDEIDDSIAQEIFESNSPRDTLIERLWDWYQEQEWDIIDNLVDDFYEKTDSKFLEDAAIIEDEEELDEEMVCEAFMDIVYVDYPEDWALEQKYCFNIIVSNGDDNYDFWLNEHIIDEDGKVDENAEKAGLIWLAKQQGHTLEQVVEALKNEEYVDPNKFISSLSAEVYDGYGCQALIFCTKMTLGQAIELKEKMKSNPIGSIVLSRFVTCGLFNPWDGSGSLLDIVCEKDVEIPFENVWKFYIDERRSNRCDSIHNVYGVTDGLWKDYVKEVKA